MAIVAIIPARYGSTRLPGKPLAVIGGKPMIRHVYESASKVPEVDRVLVATDDHRIVEAVKSFGGDVVLTAREHASGTNRLAEVAAKIEAEWIVNVQGDLPFMRPETVSQTLGALRRDPSVPMGTARTPIFEEEEWRNPNVVKVVTAARGFALYFSRAPIPWIRDRSDATNGEIEKIWGYRHVGVYVYRRDFLMDFSRLPPTELERTEGLEQLRALVHGYRIRVVDVNEPSVEVDTSEDLQKAQAYLKTLAERDDPRKWLT